jgi:hypothetical protein
MAAFIGDAGKVVKTEAKALTKQIIALTPPQGGSSRISQFVEIDVGAKRQGELAVAKDLKGIFDVIPDRLHARLIKENPGVREMKVWLSGSHTKFVVDRDFLGTNLGQMREFHSRLRSKSTGHPPRFKLHRADGMGRSKSRDKMVVSKSLYEAYRAEVWRYVGQQKGGWGQGAKLLGVAMPSWIARHANGRNGFVVAALNGPSASITLGNHTPGAVTNCQRIVQAAMQYRAAFMERNLRRMIKYGPGKTGDYGYGRT